MTNEQVFHAINELQRQVNRIERDIVELAQATEGPVSKAMERSREGTSLLRGLLWSARVLVEP